MAILSNASIFTPTTPEGTDLIYGRRESEANPNDRDKQLTVTGLDEKIFPTLKKNKLDSLPTAVGLAVQLTNLQNQITTNSNSHTLTDDGVF
jgi:hypothetical protein